MNMKTDLPLISPDDFDAFVADQVDWLNSRLKDKPTSIIPMLAIKITDSEGKQGLTIAALATDFNEDHEKRTALMAVGRKLYAEKVLPLAVALSCEAWLAQDPPKGIEPRHFAGKREVALVVAQSIGNKLTKMVSIAVKRDDRNRMESLDSTGIDGEPQYKTLHVFILDHFYRGFFEATAARMGIRL